ncbi:hypothetical protein N2152v2_002628 [Parachlorella kessleri]
MKEELAVELEALQFTYNDQLEADAAGALLFLKLVPRGTEDEFERYVRATLRLTLPPGYPTELPFVQLVDAKGKPGKRYYRLSDKQLAACQQALHHEAASLRGEMMLGHLCETAIDLVTAANHPSGDCAFCLEPVSAAGEGPAAGRHTPAFDVLKLGCYHCFHLPCFAPWWHWQQRQLAQREVQLQASHAEYKAMAGDKLRDEQIEKDGKGVYIVRCPTCRAPVPFASLAHAGAALRNASMENWTQQQTSPGSTQPLLAALGPEALQQLQQQRRQNAAALAKQQQAGGLIDPDKGVAVSLAELQVAAEAGRAAAAAEAAAAAATGAAAGAAAAAATTKQPAAGHCSAIEAGRGAETGGSGGSRNRGKGRQRPRSLQPSGTHPQLKEGAQQHPKQEGAPRQQHVQQQGHQGQGQELLPRHQRSLAHTGQTNGVLGASKSGHQQRQQQAQHARKPGRGSGHQGPHTSQPGGVHPVERVVCSSGHSDGAAVGAAAASTPPNGATGQPRGVGTAATNRGGRGSGRGGGRQHSRPHRDSAGSGGGSKGSRGQLPQFQEKVTDKGTLRAHREPGAGQAISTMLLQQP